MPTFGEWGWHISSKVKFEFGSLPVGLRYLTPSVLKACGIFPPPLARGAGEPIVSTRIDPSIMRNYLRGEQLEGSPFFPGKAYR